MKRQFVLSLMAILLSVSTMANLHFEDVVEIIKDSLPQEIGIQYIQAKNLDGQGYLENNGVVDIRVFNYTQARHTIDGYLLLPNQYYVVRFTSEENQVHLLGVPSEMELDIKSVKKSKFETPNLQTFIDKIDGSIVAINDFQIFQGAHGQRNYFTYQDEGSFLSRLWNGYSIFTTEFDSQGNFIRAPKKVDKENIYRIVK